MTGFIMPSGVHAQPHPSGGLVLLNEVTGIWHLLNRTAAEVYRELCGSAGIDPIVDNLVLRHRTIPAERIRQDVANLITGLVSRGLLEPPPELFRLPAAVLMAAPNPTMATSRRHRCIAMAAFLVALILLRLPFRTSSNAVKVVKRLCTGRTATIPEVRMALASARSVTRYYPGRLACLEMTLTVVLMSALLGRRVDWCFGFAVDPLTYHAWVEVEGVPVVEPMDDPILPTYRQVLRL